MATIKDIQTKNTMLFLSGYTDKIVIETKEEILRNRKRSYKSGRTINSPINSSGSSVNSISKKVTEDGFDVLGNSYLEDVDEGTQSTKATLTDLMRWVKQKPVKPQGGRISPTSTKALARAIQKSLIFNGIKRTAFLTDLIENSYDKLNGIEESVADDVVDSIEDILEDYGLVKKGEKYVLDTKR
jgi:hypothetical protein